jgi:glycosyltransferase involved in cell wall biosynthesis
MLLSIIIPALNEEKHLPFLLDCLVNQTNKDFEVVVCDGKSEDKTVEVINSYKDKLDIRVVVSDRRNLSHQRNFGAQNARGEYVVFMDADFTLKNDFVSSCVNFLAQTNADTIIPFSKPETKSLFWKIYFWFINNLASVSTKLGKPYGNGPGNITKREAFAKSGGYNETVFVFEDQLFFRDAKKHHLKIISTNKITMYFSLRRLKKDGFWGYFYFNVVAGFLFFFKGPIYKKFYDYQMGGQDKKKN